MKYKVIFDTNSVRNAESVSDFLGGRADVVRFLGIAEIIIPDLVIEEIKCQKKQHLISKRDSFLANPFHFLLRLDEESTKNFDTDAWISELKDKEKVHYKVITLTKNKGDILEKIKTLCLEHLPPFEASTDKGFKDAYIFFTILEYLSECKDETIFVVTNDELLKEALLKLPKVKVVKDFTEFERYNTQSLRDEYFVSRLKEELGEEITQKDIKDIWLNIDENWILKIVKGEKRNFVEVDFLSREIISVTDANFSDGINDIKTSGSFASTHAGIEEVKDYTKYMSDEEIFSLIEAATENDQIHNIAEDEDVQDFFISLYKSKMQIIPDEMKEKFEEYFKTI